MACPKKPSRDPMKGGGYISSGGGLSQFGDGRGESWKELIPISDVKEGEKEGEGDVRGDWLEYEKGDWLKEERGDWLKEERGDWLKEERGDSLKDGRGDWPEDEAED